MNNVNAVRNRKLLSMIGVSLMHEEKKDCVPVHLLGDSFGGKTTLRSALSFSLSSESPA
jgi:hypothetical protein